jgi:LacI family transcriptional regulator
MGIREVAKKAGVSTATVSRTLNTPERVRGETAARVRQAALELGYQPDPYARALVSGRTHLLGLIVSDITNPFFPELVKSCEDLAVRKGYEVIVANTDYSPPRMSQCVQRMLERRTDGVAILTSEMDPDLIAGLSGRHVPLVFLDIGCVQEGVGNVAIDYDEGIRQAFRHLWELGHRRFGFISGPLNLTSARIRRNAFLRCLHELGGDEQRGAVCEGNHKVEGGKHAMGELLKLDPRPTAVLSSNDLSAIGAIRAAREQGVRVPEDISIVGFDDIAFSSCTDPPLTTVRLPMGTLADAVLGCLFEQIEGGLQKAREYRVGTHLIVRSSTGPATMRDSE